MFCFCQNNNSRCTVYMCSFSLYLFNEHEVGSYLIPEYFIYFSPQDQISYIFIISVPYRSSISTTVSNYIFVSVSFLLIFVIAVFKCEFFLRKTPRRKIAKHMKTRHENMIVLSHCLIICLVSGLRQLNNIFLSIDIVRWMNEGFLTCLCKIFLVCYLWFGHKRN